MRLTFSKCLNSIVLMRAPVTFPSVNCWYSGVKRQEQSEHEGRLKLENVRNKYEL